MHFMNTKGVEYSAAVTSKKPGSSRSRAEASEFRKSRLNPRNQSRTHGNKLSGHAPSARVLEYARRSARALAELALAPSAAWKLLKDADGGALLYELAADDKRRKDSDYYVVRAVATVDAVVDDVLGLVDAPTTEELGDAGRALFGKYFHAGVALNKLTCSTPPSSGGKYTSDDAYAVHWLSLRSVSKLGAVDNHRDTTVVSYQDAFDLSSPASLPRVGRAAVRARRASLNLVGVHSLVSTTLADVPPLPKAEATDRVHLRDSGLVVEPLSPGLSRVSLVLSLLPPAGSSSSAEAKKSARRARKWLQTVAVAGAASLADMAAAKFPPPASSSSKENQGGANKALALQPVDPRHWRESDHCYICLKAFRAFRRCHHCRFCGEAVCGTCSGFVDAASGRAVDSGDWTNGGSGSSGSSGSGRERTSSSDKAANASQLRACNACAYELEQRLSGVLSASERPSDASSSSRSSESVSLSLYSVDREPTNGGFSLSLPDFDDVLDDHDDGYGPASNHHNSNNRRNGVVTRRPPPPPPPPAYQFAMALQRGKLNSSVPLPGAVKKEWTSSDSLNAAMRGLQQYNASLSTASSSLSGITTTSGGTNSLSDLSMASLSLGDGGSASTSMRATPSRFMDVSEQDPRRPDGVRYHFSSFSESSDARPSEVDGMNSVVGSASVSSSSSSLSFTDVSGVVAKPQPPRNDMIPLAPPPSAKPQFVVFSDADAGSGSVSSREGSSGAGGRGGGDMIPLTLL